MKKYELTNDTIEVHNRTLYRIKALKDFSNVKSGELGGYISGEHNLSHEGDSWVYDNAKVYDNAQIYDDARVYDNAHIYDDARVYGKAYISGNAQIYDDARVYDNTHICRNARIYGKAYISGNAHVCDNAQIYQDTDYTIIKGFGTKCRTTTFYRCLDNKIRVNCGCFSGTIDEFRERVEKTRGGKIAKEYLEIADLMERHFE